MSDNPIMEKLMIQLNQEFQLQHGIRSDGVLLPDYSETSIEVFGKEPGPMTLKDTGEFYESWEIFLEDDGIEMFANGEKIDDIGFRTDLLEVYGEEVVGLTEESMTIFIDRLIPLIQKTIVNVLLGQNI